ncbi:metal-dependent hydrolase [Haloterrigena salinisoli]|uniref:metal-dependent hydrolase n=1 Tax=Haloterrigena salinisoli TaxID=3132747 RepID=UPI0030CEFA2D
MMATTHALWGMALALPVLVVAPELAPTAFAAGLIGGLVPDLDLYAGHRKTFHYPVYAAVATALGLALALLTPSPATVALAVALAAAALHAAADAAGGGLELRPWQGGSERAVYSHYHRRWIRPRRWVRYDGSPEDLGLAGIAAVPVFLAADGPVPVVVLTLLSVSAVYVLFRKHFAGLAEYLVSLLPAPVLPYVPERYRGAQ